VITAMDDLTLRRVAVRLYGLHPADRAWVVAQLDRSVSDQIRGLVSELEALGLELDSSIGESILHLADWPDEGGQREPVLGDSGSDLLRSASSDQLKEILRDEPDEVLQALPRLSSFGWADDIRRDRGLVWMRSAHDSPTDAVTKAVTKAVLAAIEMQIVAEPLPSAGRMGAPADTKARVVGRGWWKRLVGGAR